MTALSICKTSLLVLAFIALASSIDAAEPRAGGAPQASEQTALKAARQAILMNRPLIPIGQQEYLAVVNKAIRAFRLKDFATLEAMANEYREQQSRLPSGEFKLQVFHFTFKNYFAEESFLKFSSWEKAEALCLEWKKAFPQSPAATIVRARLALQKAWAMRGESAAASITQQGWEGFTANLQKARNILEADKGTAAVDPGWYVTMLVIARAQQWPHQEFQALATEAITRFPNFYQIYLNIVYRLVPRWGGSYEAIEAFAQQVAANNNTGEGAAIYARIYADMAGTDGIEAYKKAKIDWPLLKKGFQKILADFPDRENIQIFAKLACLQHDKELTLQLFKQAGAYYHSAWHNSDGLHQQCIEWVGLSATSAVGLENLVDQVRATDKNFEYRGVSVAYQFDTALRYQYYPALEESYKLYMRDRDTSPLAWEWLRSFHNAMDERLERAKTMDIVFVEGLRDKIDRWAEAMPNSQLAHIERVNIRLMLAKMRADEGNQSLVAQVRSAVAPLASCDDLCEANKMIAAAMAAEPADPFWYILALRAANIGGDGIPKLKAIRDQGAKRFPFYEDILRQSLIFMIPHWRGKSLQEVTQFVEEAVTLTKERRGTALYGLMWTITANRLGLGDDFFTVTQADWQRIKKSFEEMIAQNQEYGHDGIMLLRYACLAEDKETVLSLLPKIQRNPKEADIYKTGLIDRCLSK